MLRISLFMFSVALAGHVRAQEWTTHTINDNEQLGFLIQQCQLNIPIWGRKGLLNDILRKNPHIKNPHKIRPGDIVYLPLLAPKVVDVAVPKDDPVPEPVKVEIPLSGGAYFSLWDREVTDKKTGARATLQSNLITGIWFSSQYKFYEDWALEGLFTLKKITFASAGVKDITESRSIFFGLEAGVLRTSSIFQYGFGLSYDELPYVNKYHQSGVALSTSHLVSPYLKGQWKFSQNSYVGLKFKYIMSPMQGFSLSPYIIYNHKLLNGLNIVVNPFVTVENPENKNFRYDDREMGLKLGIQGNF